MPLCLATDPMKRIPPDPRRHRLLQCLLCGLAITVGCPVLSASSLRNTAIVRAVATARPSIVNIQGQKTVPASPAQSTENSQRVNGMGTGVVVDPRGYILTNYHVVDGVREIRVTLSDGQSMIARLVARDPSTDLAIILISLERPLPLVPIGTSRDLMEGEEVIAVGNAYGYENTVTRGIISALHRTVQVTETQMYYDLIQTDASINPGNSGGPLLNIDGEMIGVNVAVRVGAQGIGFAIPVDKAMEVAARLMSAERQGGFWHGIVAAEEYSAEGPALVAREVQAGSPAEVAGIRPGDRIVKVNELELQRALDLERAMLGMQAGQETDVLLERGPQPLQVRVRLAAANTRLVSRSSPDTLDLAWETLGLRLAEQPVDEVRRGPSTFKGGLRVLSVRAASPAARQGVRAGDVLVGLHKWETSSVSDLAYILKEPNVAQKDSIKFYVLRGDETLYGHLPVTWQR